MCDFMGDFHQEDICAHASLVPTKDVVNLCGALYL